MHLALRFWTRLAIWTGILLLIFLTIPLITRSQGVAAVMAHIPVWGGLALVLAAFPAGLSVSRDTIPEGRLAVRPIVAMTLAAAAVSVFTLLLAGYVGPVAVRWLNRDASAAGAVMESAELTLGELRREMLSAVARARADTLSEPKALWLTANQLVWDYYSRIDGSALPLLFAWLGVLVGFWSRLSPRPDIRQAQHWAMGLFLVMSTYLAGENSYELIVLRADGPVFFAADFRLVVPSLLLLGIGWPTVMTLWKRQRESAGN